MIQIGIIGAGRIGKVHAESITRFVKGAEVKAIADPYLTEETKAWANAMGIAEAYGDYHKILADPAITRRFRSKRLPPANTFSAKSPSTTTSKKSKRSLPRSRTPKSSIRSGLTAASTITLWRRAKPSKAVKSAT